MTVLVPVLYVFVHTSTGAVWGGLSTAVLYGMYGKLLCGGKRFGRDISCMFALASEVVE